MAASMDNVRVKLYFPHSDHSCWFLINKEGLNTIKDVEKRIAMTYGLKRKSLELYLEDCWLPTAESVYILRDNDNIQVRINKGACKCIDGSVIRSETKEESALEPSPSRTPTCKQKSKKKRKKDREPAGNIYNEDGNNPDIEEEDEVGESKPKKKRKKSKERAVVNSTPAPAFNPQTNAKSAVSVSSLASPLQKRDDEEVQMETEGLDTSEANDEKKKARRRRRKRKSTRGQDMTPVSTVDAAKGSQQIKSTGFDHHNKRPSETRGNTALHQFQPQPHSYIKFDSEDESPLQDKSSINERMQAVANGGSPACNGIEEPNVVKNPSPSNVDTPSGDSLGKQIPNSVTPRDSLHLTDSTINEPQADVAKISVDDFIKRDIPGYAAVPPPSSFQQGYQNNTWQPKKKLPRQAEKLKGAHVFNRRKYKKEGFYPLSKEEQENSVPNTHSGIQKNGVSPPDHKAQVDKEEPSKPAPIDVSKLTLLVGPPRVGDTIVYKILEMSENYTPEVSDFTQAKVLAFDPTTGMLELELSHLTTVKKRIGKFDLVEEDDSEMDNNEITDAKIKVHKGSLMDVHLMSV